jgi:ATP-dependent Lon protease
MNERSPKIGASVILQYKEKSMLEPLNASYPVLPLRDIVVFPHMIVPLFVGRDKSVRALEEVMADDKQILLSPIPMVFSTPASWRMCCNC